MLELRRRGGRRRLSRTRSLGKGAFGSGFPMVGVTGRGWEPSDPVDLTSPRPIMDCGSRNFPRGSALQAGLTVIARPFPPEGQHVRCIRDQKRLPCRVPEARGKGALLHWSRGPPWGLPGVVHALFTRGSDGCPASAEHPSRGARRGRSRRGSEHCPGVFDADPLSDGRGGIRSGHQVTSTRSTPPPVRSLRIVRC